MARVTNKALADLIGAVDDRVVQARNEIGGVKKDVALVQTTVSKLEKAVADANGRQRTDHDTLQKVKAVQDLCPALKEPDDNPGSGKGGVWNFAKWGIQEYGIFGFLGVVILGLVMLLLAQAGLFGFIV